jgi:hypothetical protein
MSGWDVDAGLEGFGNRIERDGRKEERKEGRS